MGIGRATQYQSIQIGLESTPGTIVPANRILTGIELMQSPNIPVKTVSYQGAKGVTGTQRGQRYTDAEIQRRTRLLYTCISYDNVLWNWRSGNFKRRHNLIVGIREQPLRLHL